MSYLSDNLKYLRKLHKKQQKDIAKLVDRTESNISQWELGIRSPKMGELLKICQYYNVDLNDILEKDLRLDYIDNDYRKTEMISLFDKLNNEQRDLIISLAENMVK